MKLFAFIILCFASFNLFGDGIVLEERAMKIKTFPCMDCHGNFQNKKPSFPLSKPHNDLVFKHMDSVKSCFQCHDEADRNALRLQTGEKITFNESHKQCFQCHGEKKRDWELGMHGKMVGAWNGTKYKNTCTNCHEPHHPRFRKMKADPGPVHPHAKENASKGGH